MNDAKSEMLRVWEIVWMRSTEERHLGGVTWEWRRDCEEELGMDRCMCASSRAFWTSVTDRTGWRWGWLSTTCT